MAALYDLGLGFSYASFKRLGISSFSLEKTGTQAQTHQIPHVRF